MISSALFNRGMATKGFVLLAAALLWFISLPSPGTTANAASRPISVYVEGHSLDIHSPVKEIDGSLYVPFRELFQALGLSVQWESATKKISGSSGDVKLELKVDSRTGTVNGETVTLTKPIAAYNGVAYVPLRFVAEHSGREVSWSSSDRSVRVGAAGSGDASGVAASPNASSSSSNASFASPDGTSSSDASGPVVSASIVDPDGQPAASAKLYIIAMDEKKDKDVSVIADSQGIARASGLRKGAAYIVYAHPPEGAPFTPSNPGYRFQYDGTAMSLPVFKLQTRDVSGTALLEDGKPYLDSSGYGAMITLDRKTSNSFAPFSSTGADSNGAFYFGGLTVGETYSISTLTFGDYRLEGTTFTYDGTDPKLRLTIVYDPNRPKRDPIAEMNTGLHIRVVDQNGNSFSQLKPGDVGIDLYEGSNYVNGFGTTFGKGELILTKLQPGTAYKAKVRVSGGFSTYLVPEPFTFTYEGPDQDPLTVTLTKRDAQVVGKAVRSNGEPIANSFIRAVDADARLAAFDTWSQSDGSFKLAGLMEGHHYKVYASMSQMASGEPPAFGSAEPMEFTYSEGMQPLEPIVLPDIQLLASIQPLSDVSGKVSCTIINTEEPDLKNVSYSVGKLALWGMTEGQSYTLNYCLPRDASAGTSTISPIFTYSFVYHSGMPSLVLPADGTPRGPKKLTGKVVDDSGAPVAGATVQFSFEENGQFMAQRVVTDDDGTYSFDLFRPHAGTLYAIKGGTVSPSAGVAEEKGSVNGPTLILNLP